MAYVPSDASNKALSLLLEDIWMPPGDPVVFDDPRAQLDHDINTMRRALTSFQDHVESHISVLQCKLFMLGPIYQLPPEVLGGIFGFVHDPLTPSTMFDVNKTISLVCRRWHSICVSTPTLWNHVMNSMGLKVVKIMLKMSKHAPLHIGCYGDDWSKLGSQRFLNLVQPHMSRCKSLHISSYHTEELILRYLVHQDVPILEDLVILSKRSRASPEALNIFFKISAPSIKNFKCVALTYHLSMQHGLYSNMRTLRFSPYNHGAPFNIKDYHDLLLSSPNLEEISILGVSSYPAPTFQIADAFQVSMPHLRSIEFHFLPWKAILALMSSIHVVADASRPITASAWILQDPNPVIFPKVSESQSLLSTILTSDWLSPSSELDLKGDTLSLRFGSDSEPSVTLALQRDFIRPGNIMSHMISVGCLPRVKILETKGIGLFPAAESQWNGVSLPCLEILKIRSPWEDTRLFRRTIIPLSSPGSSSEDTSWIFPKLRYCAFDTLVDGELLKDLIEGRGRDEDGVPLSSNLPSGLELVELSNRNKMLHGESIIAHSTKHNVKLRYRDLSIW